MARPVRIEGVVQHYNWGGTSIIPDLLGVPNPECRPFAELWLGVHPSGLARIAGTGDPLSALLAGDPEAAVGPASLAAFGPGLPYLLKVLDARGMLSIQAHPSKAMAEVGFAEENARGVAPDAPNRTYRDDNHKPEVHVAITDLWMLHSFRTLESIAEAVRHTPELAPALQPFAGPLGCPPQGDGARRGVLRDLYTHVMTAPQAQVDQWLKPLLARLRDEAPTDTGSPDYWALQAADAYPRPDGGCDRGLFAFYLLNLVALKPGEGTYQPAGCLHAYLRGANVELMANSDNVLRGGLTPKYVDVPALLESLTFEEGAPEILRGEGDPSGWTRYRTGAREFELRRAVLEPRAALAIEPGAPAILLVMAGDCQVAGEPLHRGQSAFVPASDAPTIAAGPAGVEVYLATVP